MVSLWVEAILTVVLVVILLYISVGFFATGFAIGKHPEWRKMVGSPADYGLESDTVNLVSEDGIPLVAWRLLSQQRIHHGTIILAHGSGGNKSRILPRAAFLVKNGFNVLAIDLRAHGESQGNYMTPGYMEAEDILAGVNYAVQHNSERPITVMGYSYGAVAALHAAARSDKIDAVIADSAFIMQSDLMNRTLRAVMKDDSTPIFVKFGITLTRLPLMEKTVELFFYLRTHLWISAHDPKISALSAVKKLDVKPALFISGEKDTIAPPENTKIMCDTTNSSLKGIVVLPGKDHSTYTPGDQPYEQSVLEFLSKIMIPITK